MTVFDDIAQAIVGALDALDRFVSQDQADATEESMAILAEEILTGARFFNGTEVYQEAATTEVTQTPTAVSFDESREIDATVYGFDQGDSAVVVQEAGQYIVDYQAGFQGGTGDREAFANIHVNGTQIDGTLTAASWAVGQQSTGSSRALLALSSGDEVAVYVNRAGTAGTVETLENATALSITKAGP